MNGTIRLAGVPALVVALSGAPADVAEGGTYTVEYQELAGLLDDFSVPFQEGAGELVSEVQQDSGDPTSVRALVITDRSGSVTSVPDTFAGSRPYRCATDPGQF